MLKKIGLGLVVILGLGLSGCATVPTTTETESNQAKKFELPEHDNAGIYVYRTNSSLGAALKKDVFINGECVGETAKGVFFYQEVAGDKEHSISTESEFSPNAITLFTEKGRLYFVEQYIKMGVFVGGAGVKIVDESVGRAEVLKTNMATKGTCSS
ncbi:DUF2846 domain-containing protein [Thaumasiovibrio sp. DFM-14]|uniref:DUF2846 domain-containing protein n=1 Tax=Thaumasiovibrio sp. DFM-14 TaxID=3384792 RepID=UPI00399FC333